MDALNYHHLYRFWRVAREGGLSQAAAKLDVTHSTLSAQVRELEEFLATPLFERRGKRLILTLMGEQIAAQADDIFRLGAEVVDLARGGKHDRARPLRIGIVGHLPKTIAYRLVQPALATGAYAPLVARQAELTTLLDELAGNRLHAVLADGPAVDPATRVFSHPLGASKVVLYGRPQLVRRLRRDFPKSLAGVPMLMPLARSSLRRQIERWFTDRRIRVRIQAEFDDAGMMRAAGIDGLGIFPVRAALRSEVDDTRKAEELGWLDGVVERYYVISREHRVSHPGVGAVIAGARLELADEQRAKE